MTAGSVAVPTVIPLKVIAGRKYTVDIATPIELKSATKDATVFYTIDGYRPDPFNLKRLGQPSTFVYKAPFTLPAGRTTIRAVALSADGWVSSCVTKTFTVLQQGSLCSDDADVSEASLPHEQSQNELDRDTSPTPASSPSVPNSPSSAAGTLAPSSPAISPERGGETPPPGRGPGAIVLTEQQICMNCWMPCSDNAKHKFCLHCGSVLPPTAQGTPTNLSQKSHGPISPSQYGLAATSSGILPRPPHPPPPFYPAGPVTVMRLDSQGNHNLCGVCGRANALNMRFCDWCGSRPDVPVVPLLTCQSCLTSLDSSSRYCYSCGAVVVAPPRQSTDLNSHQKRTVGTQVDSLTEAPPTATKPCELVSTSSVSTQTEEHCGSEDPCHRKAKKTKENSSREKVNNLRPYSPGKGLWRVQLEHIANHLKAYTQNCDEFQGNIGCYEMGKLLHASTETEQDTKELSLKLMFALKCVGLNTTSLTGKFSGASFFPTSFQS